MGTPIFVFIFFTLFFIYRILDREFGIFAALAGTVTLTSGLLTILEKGNVTEEYALVFQALGFWLFLSAWRRDFLSVLVLDGDWAGWHSTSNKRPSVSGSRTGFFCWRSGSSNGSFLLKIARSIGWMAAPIGCLDSLSGKPGAFDDYWEQAFLYNFVYIGKHEGIRRLIPVFLKGFAYLQNGWVLYLASAWLAGSNRHSWLKRKDLLGQAHPLVLTGW